MKQASKNHVCPPQEEKVTKKKIPNYIFKSSFSSPYFLHKLQKGGLMGNKDSNLLRLQTWSNKEPLSQKSLRSDSKKKKKYSSSFFSFFIPQNGTSLITILTYTSF